MATAQPPTDIHEATADDVAAACVAAAQAAPLLVALSLEERARLLRAAADALDAHTAELVKLADAETSLGEARLTGEVGRTTGQLRLLADQAAAGAYLDLIETSADPAATPPRPALRRYARPIGPVAVYAASNFPFAFSVAGGDTASALAAGCPVVVKAHPGHPATSQRTAELVLAALAEAGAPAGTFALLHGFEAGRLLVTDPRIRAAAFTGSVRGGRALYDLASGRPDPIPFYGELGSVNPVVVTPAAAAARGAEVARGYTASFTLGAGQFCTKPGILFLPAGHGLEGELADAVGRVPAAPLLTDSIREAYDRAAAELAELPGVRVVARGAAEGGGAQALLCAVDADTFAATPELAEEHFGPTSLVVEYDDPARLPALLDAVPGSLTATVHGEAGDPQDAALARRLFAHLEPRAGRLLWNGWPTGVAVAPAMQHGGPWPATTSPLHTSVGTTAVRRFLVPVVYQDVPEELLPAALRG